MNRHSKILLDSNIARFHNVRASRLRMEMRIVGKTSDQPT